MGLLCGASPWLARLLVALKGRKAGVLLVVTETHSSKHAVWATGPGRAPEPSGRALPSVCDCCLGHGPSQKWHPRSGTYCDPSLGWTLGTCSCFIT